MLLNGLAVSKMQQGLFEEAETHLNDALNHVSPDYYPLALVLENL
jgi:Tfp pilus assembly protein PilF